MCEWKKATSNLLRTGPQLYQAVGYDVPRCNQQRGGETSLMHAVETELPAISDVVRCLKISRINAFIMGCNRLACGGMC